MKKPRGAFNVLKKILFEAGYEVGGKFHCVQAKLHLTGLFVVHGCAKLVIGDELIICAAKRVKHLSVFRREFVYVHNEANSAAHKEANHEIHCAETDDYEQHQGDKHGTYDNGYGGVACSGFVHKTLACAVHAFNKRIGHCEVKNELPDKEEEPKPTGKKQSACP